MEPSDFAISIRPGAFGAASAVVRLCHPNEIGGILIGYRHDNGIVVLDALHVPSQMRPTRYERSHALASLVLDTYFGALAADSPAGYVGEWHSHPTVHSASSQDLVELSDIALATASLVGLLVVGADDDQIVPFGYLCDPTGVPWPAQIVCTEPELVSDSPETDAQDVVTLGGTPIGFPAAPANGGAVAAAAAAAGFAIGALAATARRSHKTSPRRAT